MYCSTVVYSPLAMYKKGKRKLKQTTTPQVHVLHKPWTRCALLSDLPKSIESRGKVCSLSYPSIVWWHIAHMSRMKMSPLHSSW